VQFIQIFKKIFFFILLYLENRNTERQDGMNKKLDTEEVRHLFEGIQQLKGIEEYFRFFEDVCTINELLAIAQRYEVAKMLREGKTYIDIAKLTGASTATISRVNRSLSYGEDGYSLVFDRLEKKET
jgi:TrpR-related protein YerC/YecD